MKFSEMKDTYRGLWATIKVTDMSATDAVVDKIMKNKARYEKVQKMSGVWWPVIAAIHSLEASLSFKGHLHNGDPLTAKTVHVPAGRPTGNAMLRLSGRNLPGRSHLVTYSPLD